MIVIAIGSFAGISSTATRTPKHPSYVGFIGKPLRNDSRVGWKFYASQAPEHIVSFNFNFLIDFPLTRNFRSNKLTLLPEALGKCVKLETLNAMNNVISSVPLCYSNLTKLKQIILSNNQISEFPAQFAGSLSKLDVLDLSRNIITSVPAAAKDLYCTELNLNQNQISSLAEEIAECPKLKTLRLEENCLQVTAIPTKILKQSVISTILVDGNLFNSKQFHELDGYDDYQERNTAMKKKM